MEEPTRTAELDFASAAADRPDPSKSFVFESMADPDRSGSASPFRLAESRGHTRLRDAIAPPQGEFQRIGIETDSCEPLRGCRYLFRDEEARKHFAVLIIRDAAAANTHGIANLRKSCQTSGFSANARRRSSAARDSRTFGAEASKGSR